MIDRLIIIVKRLRLEPGTQGPNETERRLAIAALLVRTATIDGDFDASERVTLKSLFEEHFSLSPEQTEQLLTQAHQRENDAVDLFGFTKIITSTSDAQARRAIVAMMWEVVYADGWVDDYEANLVWRASELIGVTRADRIALRQEAERRFVAGK
ncbi:MAG: TerB family tellurite resistance protein [Alphaproteobacteria bacterium]